MELKCELCRHHRKPVSAGAMGRCCYPVPQWIMMGPSGGYVIGYEADGCATFDPTNKPEMNKESDR